LLTLSCDRYLFRRSAFRALQSSPTSLVFRSRSITTNTRVKLQSSRQWAVTPFQRRFASEEAEKSTTVDEIADQSPLNTEGETSSTSTDGEQSSQESLTSKVESAAAEALGSFSQASGPSIESTKMNQGILQTSAASETAQATNPTSDPFSSAPAASPSSNRQFVSPPATPNSTLYVGNLYFEVSEDALQRQFTPFGPIKKVKIIYDHRGLSKG
jgi:hypothetical protein